MTSKNEDYVWIDFTGIFKAIISKFWIILLTGALCAAIAGGYALLAGKNSTYVPMYKSTAKLYVTGNYTSTPSANAKSLGQSFTEDFFELMKSNKVIDQVIEDLSLNMTNKELISCISKSTVSQTCMVYLTVVFPDAELSKAIVDDLLVVTSAYAIEIMGMTPPKVYEEAQVPLTSINSHSSYNTRQFGMYGFLGGCAAALLFIVVLFLIDNKLRTPKQVNEKMMLPVLTAVINFKNMKGIPYNNLALQNLYGCLYSTKSDAKAIAFLSGEKEDKTQLIRTYGQFLKQIGKKVIIVDTNLSFNKGSNKNGIKDYLRDCVEDIETIIYSEDGIDFIDSGDPVSNAVELLKSSTFIKLMSLLRSKYDYILLNTTSTEYAADAIAVAEQSDLNIVVAEVGKTKMEVVQKLVEKYIKDGRLTGVVMTGVVLRKRSREFKHIYGKYMGII